MRLVRLPRRGKAVFVGDTHGDLQASRVVVKTYLPKNYTVVFLGDYVDRGPQSRENLDYLLALRETHENLVLLAGNHEMYPIESFRPAEFWEGLSPSGREEYGTALASLPLAAEGKGFLALHGVPPDVASLKAFEGIETGSPQWFRMMWGDFREKEGEDLGPFLGRPRFGSGYFFRVMKTLRKHLLIRSHDPRAPEWMFGGRCLTIFTSSAYGRDRRIAVVNLSGTTRSCADVELVTL